ncbi:hypothetical protein Q8791_23095 [Nocardiopsis sp. CT-R113]|uniref:Small CPxCG-related zinc finger protein n=1 Tax=Nocardiopsis codii TaxID=3065942 RepID=A0ABU7KCZ5_9ACTN|nr:hypothetical protein [Nocardiopsis sp. CT-R113]MEE2040108.1 hypothetical protein [Nocardiopsis sp. CT-R113]
MTVRRVVYQGQAVYVLTCFRCGTAHLPPAPPAYASTARAAGRDDGWQADRRTQERKPDLCPPCQNTTKEHPGDASE